MLAQWDFNQGVDVSSQQNVENLRALFQRAAPDGTDLVQLVHDDAAWAAYSELLAPDVVYEDNYLPDHAAERYRGLEGYRRAAATFAEPFEEMIYDLERIVGSGDRVVSIHRVRARARQTGISFDLLAAYALRFQDGKIVHIQAFMDAQDALKAAGLENDAENSRD
jgi:ketosteroid isomerase-like protein